MFTATNPTTGEVIHQYPTHTSEEVSTAIEDAQSAFQAWRKTTFAERAALLNKVADLMAEDEERLARLMTVEMGKPIREAYGEVQKPLGVRAITPSRQRAIWHLRSWRRMPV